MIDADDRYLKIEEGPINNIRLGRKYIKTITDRVLLSGPVSSVFAGLNVIDASGEFAGIVRDTVESGDVLDSFIIESEEGEMLVVTIEDVSLIDDWVEIRITMDELFEGQ